MPKYQVTVRPRTHADETPLPVVEVEPEFPDDYCANVPLSALFAREDLDRIGTGRQLPA